MAMPVSLSRSPPLFFDLYNLRQLTVLRLLLYTVERDLSGRPRSFFLHLFIVIYYSKCFRQCNPIDNNNKNRRDHTCTSLVLFFFLKYSILCLRLGLGFNNRSWKGQSSAQSRIEQVEGNVERKCCSLSTYCTQKSACTSVQSIIWLVD